MSVMTFSWIKSVFNDIISEPCTLWFNGIWGDCCEGHDHYAPSMMPWLQNNWYLARCVAASTYSAKYKEMSGWKKVAIRRIVAPAMFIGTSTVGWLWRFKALLNAKGGSNHA